MVTPAPRPTPAAAPPRPAPGPGVAAGETHTSVIPAQSSSQRDPALGDHGPSTSTAAKPTSAEPSSTATAASRWDRARVSSASQAVPPVGREGRPAVDAGSIRRTARRACATDATWNSVSASPGRARTHPADSKAPRTSEPTDHLRPRRQAGRGVERRRPVRPPRRSACPGSPTASTELAAGAEPARGAQQPVAEPLGLPGGQAAFAGSAASLGADPEPHRGTGRDRLAGHDVGDRDRGDRAVLGADRRGRAVGPRLHHAEQVGHRGTAGGPGLARAARRRTTTRCPTQCGPRPGGALDVEVDHVRLVVAGTRYGC